MPALFHKAASLPQRFRFSPTQDSNLSPRIGEIGFVNRKPFQSGDGSFSGGKCVLVGALFLGGELSLWRAFFWGGDQSKSVLVVSMFPSRW